MQQWPTCIIFKLFLTDSVTHVNLPLSTLNCLMHPDSSPYILSTNIFLQDVLKRKVYFNPPSFVREDATVWIIPSLCEGSHKISSHQQSTAVWTPPARCFQTKCSVSLQITVKACSSHPSHLRMSKNQGSGFVILRFNRSLFSASGVTTYFTEEESVKKRFHNEPKHLGSCTACNRGKWNSFLA